MDARPDDGGAQEHDDREQRHDETVEGVRTREAPQLHVRDADGGHILDAGLYHEAIAELQRAVPEMHLQMTTETVGKYQPGDMRDIVRAVVPQGASVGVREMIPDGVPKPEDIEFYNWTLDAGIQLQHICYGPEDVALLAKLLDVTELNRQGIWCLFVIGHRGNLTNDTLLN